MNVLVISEQITSGSLFNADIEFVNWKDGSIDAPLGEFNIVIVDMTFDRQKASLGSIRELYLDLENRFDRRLISEKGLVVIIICGYEQKKIFDYEEVVIDDIEKYPSDDLPVKTKTIPREKHTYSLLEKLDRNSYERMAFPSKGRRYDEPQKEIYRGYFEYVEHYFVSVQDLRQDDFVPIAKTQGIGDECIAFNRKIGAGHVIYLPSYRADNRKVILDNLLTICGHFYQKQQNIIYERIRAQERLMVPSWLELYKSHRHKQIPLEMDSLRREEEMLDRVCFLLYGRGDRLEEEVKLALEQLGMSVTKSSRGESIDLVCTFLGAQCNMEFFIEVTGTNHSINITDKKVGQVVDYKSEYPEKKVILLANTFCNLSLNERTDKRNFADKVCDTLSRLDILMMTTSDLFWLWKAVYEKNIDEHSAVSLMYQSKGVFKLPDAMLPDVLTREGGS